MKWTHGNFYGPLAKTAIFLFRAFSPKYHCQIPAQDEPVVYVCRHLNMHGPFTTLKWLSVQTHPMSLHVFLERESSIRQFREYTFSKRYGKEPKKHSFLAWVVGSIVCKTLQSFHAVPTYRDSNALKTIRGCLTHLMNGENVIVWPDIAYTEKYDQPCKIYNGFLILGEMYYKKTGKELKFIPLYIDDQNRQIIAREPVTLLSYKEECEQTAARLEYLLNPIPGEEQISLNT